MLALTLLVGISAIYLFVGFESGNLETGKPETRLEMVQHRLASGFSMKSNQDRLLMWESAWQGIQDHFWLGIGYGKDSEVMETYRKKIRDETGHRFTNSASAGVHNIFLQTWLNYGIFGFASFLGIWIVFFQKLIQGLKKTVRFDYGNCILWGAISGIGGFLTAGFFENNFRDGEVQTAALLLISLALFQLEKQSSPLFSKK